jgi:hypothetical protein
MDAVFVAHDNGDGTYAFNVEQSAAVAPSNYAQETGGNLDAIETDIDALAAVEGAVADAVDLVGGATTISAKLRGAVQLLASILTGVGVVAKESGGNLDTLVAGVSRKSSSLRGTASPVTTQTGVTLLDGTAVAASFNDGALYFANTTDKIVTFAIQAKLNTDLLSVVTFTLPVGNGTAQRYVVSATQAATIIGSGPTYTLNTAAELQALLSSAGVRFKVLYSATSPTTGSVTVELNQN